MRTCKNCNAILNDNDILELCADCYSGRKPIVDTRPEKRPLEWPTHCVYCGVKFRDTNTYCYDQCPDCPPDPLYTK
jgi:predicted  nucleic acid-binding Zn-ribbon protein